MAGAVLTPLPWHRLLSLLIATLILHLALIQPNHPAAMTWGALRLFALELPFILLTLIALQGRGALAFRLALTAVLTVIAVLKAADYAMFTALARGFNPVADLVLIDAGFRLLAGAIGTLPAIAAGIAALLAPLGIAAALWWATGRWAALQLPTAGRGAAGLGAFICAGLIVAQVGQSWGTWRLPVAPPGAAFTTRVGLERVILVRETLADLRAFRIAARRDPLAQRADLLNGIDRDVIVVFVESYGRTSLDTPFYADTHRATLQAAEDALEQRGFAMVSGLLNAPTRGGQSWLSHATFANGLWVDDQTRYRAALASGRETLFHLAAKSGFHTAAVMPQITMDWPESSVMGFDTVLGAADLGYAGAPFNWVTMPDQFTYLAMDRLVRDRVTDTPVFVQVATGTSHAPWVPVPELVPWESIDDGRIFNDMALSGDPPEEVWRDRDRVRSQYRDAIDYALRTVFDYAARHAEEPPLMIVLGDHQAADFVSLDTRAEVPIHVLGPADLVARIADWGWTPGLIPDVDLTPVGMEQMRDRLIEAFTTGLALQAEAG